MKQRDIILTSSLLLTVVVGMFVYTFLAREEIIVPKPIATSTSATPELLQRINAKHFFNNGVHTITGEIDLPTPCDLLEYDAAVAESFPEQISFNFSTINNSESCAQVITTQRFLISANASEAAGMTATFNGQPAELNLIEATTGETPDQFELYFKG